MPRHFGRYPVLKRAPLLLAEGVISNSFFFLSLAKFSHGIIEGDR